MVEAPQSQARTDLRHLPFSKLVIICAEISVKSSSQGSGF